MLDPFTECRQSHWLKPMTGDRVPRHWVVCAASSRTITAPGDPTQEIMVLDTFACERFYRSSAGYSGFRTQPVTTEAAAVAALYLALWGGEQTWVIASGMSRILAQIGWWDEVTAGHVRPCKLVRDKVAVADGVYRAERPPLSQYVISDPPFIVSCWWRDRRVIFLDLENYTPASVHDLGEEQGDAMPQPGELAWPDERPSWALAWEICVIWRSIASWLGAWESERLGSWSTTVAGLADHSYRRSHLPAETVLIHGDTRALLYERWAYYAGQAMPNFVGVVRGPGAAGGEPGVSASMHTHDTDDTIVEVDVVSQYPYLFAAHSQPSKLLGHRRGITGSLLLGDRQQRWIVAYVRIQTEQPIYPVRVWPDSLRPVLGQGGEEPECFDVPTGTVIYPVGTFDTILCGDDLWHAIDCGHLADVYDWYEYEARPIDCGWVGRLHAMRRQAESMGLHTWARLCKQMLQSLVGRFGQRSLRWEPEAGIPLETPWGRWCQMDTETGEIIHLRMVGGQRQRQIGWRETDSSCPAIAANVTCLSRHMMRRLRETVGPRQWYYQDTDSLHVSVPASRLIRTPHRNDTMGPGMVRVTRQCHSATYYGTRCYRWGGQWSVSGVASETARWHDGSVDYTIRDRAGSIMARGPGSGIRLTTVHREIGRTWVGGVVGPDGWVEPYRIEQ